MYGKTDYQPKVKRTFFTKNGIMIFRNRLRGDRQKIYKTSSECERYLFLLLGKLRENISKIYNYKSSPSCGSRKVE